MKESDLSPIVKDFLYSQGCTEVHGELLDIDLVGFNKGIIYAVELKLKLNLKVVEQAMKRVGLAHYVYIAVPYERSISHLIKINPVYKFILDSHGIGLILIHPTKEYGGITHNYYEVIKQPKLYRAASDIARQRASDDTLDKDGGHTSEARYSPYKSMLYQVYHYIKNRTNNKLYTSINNIITDCPKVSKHYANPRGSIAAELNRRLTTFEKVKILNKIYYKLKDNDESLENYY